MAGSAVDAYQVVHMLPNNKRVLIQIGNIRPADTLRVLLHDEPANVRIDETLPDRVRVLDRVRVPMMRAVALRPPTDGALGCSDTYGGQVYLQG
jgi:hypothetical protein